MAEEHERVETGARRGLDRTAQRETVAQKPTSPPPPRPWTHLSGGRVHRCYSGAGAGLQGKIALTTKKDNGLVKAYAAALDELIKSGDYAKILARWNLSTEAVTAAEVNPPGLPIEGK